MTSKLASEKLKVGQSLFFKQPPDFKGAVEAFHLVTQHAPKWAEGFHWLGAGLEKSGQLKDALEAYRRATELDTKDSRPLISMGVCLAGMGRLNEAIRELRNGLNLKPHYGEADARLYLASALEQKGLIKEAIAEWRTVAAMKSQYPSYDSVIIKAKEHLAKHGIKVK